MNTKENEDNKAQDSNTPSNINSSTPPKHKARYAISLDNGIYQIFIYGDNRERDPIGFFNLSSGDLKAFQAWTNESLKRLLSEKICQYYDISELLNMLKGDPNLKPKEILPTSNIKLLDEEYTIVNPALDLLPDGSLIITQSQFVERLKTRIVKKVVNGRKVEESEVYTIKEPINITYTSKGEFFETTASEFEKRNLYAKIPSDLIPGRWSVQSRMEFLSGKASQIGPYLLYKKINNLYDQYIDFHETKGGPAINAVYSMLTYIYPIFDSLAYLKFEGEIGSGKTKIGQIHSLIDFNGTLSVSATPASLYRTIEDERPTVVIDELENTDSDSEIVQAIIPILNSGYNKFAKVTRIEPDGVGRKRVRFSAYGPKIICAINPLLASLASRSYVIRLISSLNPEKANLEVIESDPKWQAIRDELYLFAMQNYQKIQELVKSKQIKNTLNLTGREWEKAYPLLTISYYIAQFAPEEGKKLISDITDFITQTREERSAEIANSWEADIIYVVLRKTFEELEKINEDKRLLTTIVTIPQLEIALEVGGREGFDVESPKFNKTSYSRKVGLKLRNMGLTIKTIASTGNFTSIQTDLKHVLNAIARYKIQIQDVDTSNLTSLTSLTSLTQKLKKWVGLASEGDLVNLKDDWDKRNKNNSDWGYFKVIDGFDFYSDSNKKYRFKKGQVIKFPVIKAPKYIQDGFLKPACPGGVWDPVSKECIPDLGGINNDQ